MTNPLLQAAERHCAAIRAIIDELGRKDDQQSLRALSSYLSRLAFRAAPKEVAHDH